jgi:hypothetical protein
MRMVLLLVVLRFFSKLSGGKDHIFHVGEIRPAVVFIVSGRFFASRILTRDSTPGAGKANTNAKN